MENKNEVMAPQEDSLAVQLSGRNTMFCSMKHETPEEKALMFKAMNAPDAPLDSMVGQVIYIKDVFAEQAQFMDDDGVLSDIVRIVLVTTDGQCYGCSAKGIFSSIQHLIAIYGQPTWHEGVPVKVVIEKTRKGWKVLKLAAA